jgi:hypothetical protein
MTDSQSGLQVHGNIVTVPHYLAEALATLCDDARLLERQCIAAYLDSHCESQGKTFGLDVLEGRHHDH